jgi:hypothetical protein
MGFEARGDPTIRACEVQDAAVPGILKTWGLGWAEAVCTINAVGRVAAVSTARVRRVFLAGACLMGMEILLLHKAEGSTTPPREVAGRSGARFDGMDGRLASVAGTRRLRDGPVINP